ncbi:helix-turn-helix domain-containing protein [Candidatus Binatus sp.]|uniref:AlbA family DNA-binding domain-containing protein n=1 Tax=Candidatus Binatus sp. TaxID=2811406 RepID=UPI003BB13F4C
MNKSARNRLLFALLFFAGLFTLIAWLQYWFVKDQLHRTIVSEMNDWADEVVDEINYNGKWNLAGYRRSNPEAPTYFIVTADGFLVDIEGLVSGMVPAVRVPAGLIYDQPFSVVSEIGEQWRLFAKRVRGGSVILGVPLSDSHPDTDDRLKGNGQSFGATIDSAAEVTDRQVDLTLEYAVIDDSGRLQNAAGGIPLLTNPAAVNQFSGHGSFVTLDGDPYFTVSRQIADGAANLVLFKDIELEQQMLHNSFRFNMTVAGACWFICAMLAGFYLYGKRGPRITCEQAISQDEGQTIEFKSSLRWDFKLGRVTKEKEVEGAVVKSVAAFLNSDGGILMIGVSDDKVALGLDADYRSITDKPNKDGFLLTLQQVLSNAFGIDNSKRYLRIDFCTISGKEICVVYVKPARREVFVAERTALGPRQSFYIRDSNATKSLEGKEMLAYIRQHWGM